MKTSVFKIGGDVTGYAENIRRFGERLLHTKDKAVLVVSAMKGVTDQIECGIEQRKVDITKLKEQHLYLAKDLGVFSEDLERRLDAELREVNLPLGERLAALLIGEYLSKDFNSTGERSFTLGIKLRTEGESTLVNNECIPYVRQRMLNLLERNNLIVVTGFEGVDPNGGVGHFDRNGSDITATFIANCIDADSVHLVKDSAICAADPKIVVGARVIPNLDYRSAAEAGSIHFDAMGYVEEKRIPTFVESIRNGDVTKIDDKKTEYVVIGGIERCKLLSIEGVRDSPGAELVIRRLISEVKLNKITQYEGRNKIRYLLNDPKSKKNPRRLQEGSNHLRKLLARNKPDVVDCSYISLSGNVIERIGDQFFRLAKWKISSSRVDEGLCHVAVPMEHYLETIKDEYNGLIRKR